MTKKEKIIENYVDNLGISLIEAEKLYNDDMNGVITSEGEELTEKAKQVINRTQSNTTNKPKQKRKKDSEKIEIINTIFDLLVGKAGFEDVEIKNEQKEITFGQYSLNLIKHRPPKE